MKGKNKNINEGVPLADGEYPCNATLHIKDGKAVIVLHTMFGLAPGEWHSSSS